MLTSIGFTGTQRGMTPPQHEAVAHLFSQFGADVRFHHGLCIGSDAQAHQLARARSWYVIGHPCDLSDKQINVEVNELREVKRPLDRNDDIVADVQYLVATPAEEHEVGRSGTWATVRRGQKRRIPVYLVLPDGRVEIS